jgi:Domain of unknown function (DUF1707)/Cell wall-active antibiotics response 4TMS YvqF
VVAVLAEAAGDGRLTLEEHSERTERAYAARTLGELAVLTDDLAVPSGQPIRLDGRRPVAAVFGREQRDGRWVVPEHLAVAAIFGEVVLDLRDALLQASRTVVMATVVGGTVVLIVPEGIAVETTGTAVLTRTSGQLGRPLAAPDAPVIEVRTLALAGRVKVIRPRQSRWRGMLNARRSVRVGRAAARPLNRRRS